MDASEPNIVWVSVDSLRPDHLPLGGGKPQTGPELSRIANSDRGQWVEDCVAQGRWTPASTASILTCTHLSTHGLGASSNAGELPDDLDTIPELLQGHGYQTAGLSSNAFLSSASNLDRGFERFGYFKPSELHRTAGLSSIAKYVYNVRKYGGGFSFDTTLHNRSYIMHDVAKRWIADFSDEEPFFTYIHYNSTHCPYTPPRPFLEPFLDDIDMSVNEALSLSKRVYANIYGHIASGCNFSQTEWETLNALYDAEIAYVDELIGKLFDYVIEEIDSDTIFVITGDHGELFGEEGLIGHCISVHNSIITVPLITYNFPCEIAGDNSVVEHVDIMTTLAKMVGLEVDQAEGVDLREKQREVALSQRGPRQNDFEEIRSHNPNYDMSDFYRGHVNVARSAEYKLVAAEDRTELFEIPDETADISAQNPAVKEEFLSSIPESAKSPDEWRGVEKSDAFDEELSDRLSAMGYL